MEILFVIALVINFAIFFMTLLVLIAGVDYWEYKYLKQYLLSTCIINGLTTILLIIFINTTPLALHTLDGSAVIEYKIQNGNVVDSCYVYKNNKL